MGAVLADLTWRLVNWISTTPMISTIHRILAKAMGMMWRMVSCHGQSLLGQPREKGMIVHNLHPEVVAQKEIGIMEGMDRSQIELGAMVGSHQVAHRGFAGNAMSL